MQSISVQFAAVVFLLLALESGVIGRVTLDYRFVYDPGESDVTTWPHK